jgi:CheY-like chemotaxis protein
MTVELLSLRALVVSRSKDLADLFRRAASSSVVPIEIIEAADTASVHRSLGSGGGDLAYIDGALPPEEIARVISAVRAVAKPPFTVLLAMEPAAEAFETDGLAVKPSWPEEARGFLERSMRVRLPSRVLIVDDSSTMRMIVRKILAATRFPLEVDEVERGIEAIELARKVEFDIVFLDYNMPGFSGLETMGEFRREKRRAHFVLITSTQDDALAERARARGAAFLKKPFFPADIEAVLCRFYGLRQLNPKRA